MASSTMAMARALTKRTKRSLSTAAHTLNREGNVRYPPGTVNRDLISLPTELISTTNVNALNYPDISSLNPVSSSNSSISSGNESDFITISRSFIDSPVTTPETSSVEASPVSDPIKNLSFFDVPHRPATDAGNRPSSSNSSMDVPAIPKRALSHSKKAHQELARTRSISRMSPPPSTLAGPTIVRNSTDIFGATDPSHPFVKELAQVNEVAEEFGLVSANLAQEEQDLISKGLQKFGVKDYLDEIQGLYGGVFEDKLGPMAKPRM